MVAAAISRLVYWEAVLSKYCSGRKFQAGGALLGLLLLVVGVCAGILTLKLVIELFPAKFFGFKAIVGPMLALVSLLIGGPITLGLLSTGIEQLRGR